MRVLLDTHVVIWAAADPERLGALADVIEDAHNDLLISAVTAWEIVLKNAAGRLRLPEHPARWFHSCAQRLAATLIPVSAEECLAVADLPNLHDDPFDRLLIAQSKVLRVPLATGDEMVRTYPVDTITP